MGTCFQFFDFVRVSRTKFHFERIAPLNILALSLRTKKPSPGQPARPDESFISDLLFIAFPQLRPLDAEK